MSFILDALRKSDARRKQGEVPDIHSQAPTEPLRRSRSWLALWVVAFILVALAAVAAIVLALRGDLPGLPSDDPAPVLAVEPIPEPVEPIASDDVSDRPEPETEELSEENEAPQDERRRRRARLRPEADTDTETRPDTASERAARVRERSRSREARQREAEPVSSEAAAEEIARRLAEAEAEAESEPADTASASEVERPADPERENDSDRSENRVADYVEQWELPLSTRRSLPELSLSIHVYSGRPEERFVLINGERYVEGDSVGDGVDLVEIRREGAVVDYQSQRFLLRRQ